MSNDVLELFSFEVDSTVFETERVFYIKMPISWWNLLETDKENFKLKFKLQNLGKKIQAVFTTIFNVSWKKKGPWLLAVQEVDLNIIKLICLNWFAKENECTVSELPPDVQQVQLVWQSAMMGELNKEYKKEDWKYNWIPGLMARKFASKPRNLTISNGSKRDLIFHHVFFNGNHECMSKPIKSLEKNGAFSYVIRFSLRNRGGLPEQSILNVSFGIRRFLQRGILNHHDIHPKRKGSILISLQDPFIEENLQSLSYAQLKYKKQRNGQVTWADGADNLFADLLRFPFQPEQILQDPLKYMESEDPSAFAVYSDLIVTSKYNLSKVVSGIGLPEKWALFDLIKTTFDDLKPLEPCTKISLRKHLIGNDRFPLRHSYVQNSKLCLEFWGGEELYHQAITTYLNEKIIFENTDGSYRLNAEPIVNFDFKLRNTGKLAEALDLKLGNKASEHRVKLVGKMAGVEKDDPLFTMSLIEIGKKEDYENGTDPKQADRDGLALSGRVSQFVYPLDSEEKDSKTKSRLMNSLFDLLMDHGFLPARVSNLSQNTIFLGLGMIKGKAKGQRNREVLLPVVTRIQQSEVKIRLFGRNEWLPVREALLASGKLTLSSFLNKPTSENESVIQYKSFFKRAVENCLQECDSNIVIFIDAKLRKNEKWTELTNPMLDQGKLPFVLEHPDANHRVRAVRVNTTDDVSQYRINPKGEVKENRNQGLYKDPSGIYYSVGARPDNMQASRTDMEKYNFPKVQILHQSPVELIPLGTDIPEERDQLAIWTHHLRKLNIAYSFHTILPYPLDIMKSIKKYLTVVEEGDFEEYDPDVFEEWIFEEDNNQLAFTLSETQ